MKIAILGGSFDPPHFGHWLVANQVRELLNLDEIWLMPCASHPFHKITSSAEHRLKMTRFLAGKQIKVSDYEIKNDKTSYTIDTLNYFQKKYPNNEFFWIIGSDQIKDFKKWHCWQQIINKYSLIIFPREKNHLDLKTSFQKSTGLITISKSVVFLDHKDVVVSNISSTLIKARIKMKESVLHFVPEKVAKYIKVHHLYSNI